MKNRFFLLLIGSLLFPVLMFAQQIEKREKYDISKDKVLYTIGYAHLDTEWNWEYPTTIIEYIKMKEYYPDSYKKVAEYIKQGRWFISGSSVDEGEVNISSSESVLRQVLYGNLYFKREFDKESYDYM